MKKLMSTRELALTTALIIIWNIFITLFVFWSFKESLPQIFNSSYVKGFLLIGVFVSYFVSKWIVKNSIVYFCFGTLNSILSGIIMICYKSNINGLKEIIICILFIIIVVGILCLDIKYISKEFKNETFALIFSLCLLFFIIFEKNFDIREIVIVFVNSLLYYITSEKFMKNLFKEEKNCALAIDTAIDCYFYIMILLAFTFSI